MRIAFQVNGTKQQVEVPPMKRLLDTLREDLGLTGTKEGCGEGECGACTVLVGGEPVNSCLVPTCQVAGEKVVTIEGLGKKKLHGLQESFLACGGAQCGICTPGMIVAASTLPEHPTLPEIQTGLAGNLCRCTGYARIYDAVWQALGAPRSDEKKAGKATKRAAQTTKDKPVKSAKADKVTAMKVTKKATKSSADKAAKKARKSGGAA